jgi:hypothetical protein
MGILYGHDLEMNIFTVEALATVETMGHKTLTP